MSKIGYNAIGRGKLATDFRAPTNSGIRAVRAVAKSQADAQTAKLASFLIGVAGAALTVVATLVIVAVI